MIPKLVVCFVLSAAAITSGENFPPPNIEDPNNLSPFLTSLPIESTSEDRKLSMIRMLNQLVRASDRAVVKDYTFPDVEENGSVHFLGVGGHLLYKLVYKYPSQTKLTSRKKLLTISMPLEMENLIIRFDKVHVKREKYRFDDGIKITFPQAVPLVVEIVINRVAGACEKDVFDVVLDKSDFEVNIVDDIKNSFKMVSLHMWHKIMLQIKRMIETHALYVLRKSFKSLGPSFGQELCLIKTQNE